MAKKLRVALLAGGRSGEREVSLKGAEGVARALDPGRYEVLRYDPATDLARLVAEAGDIDVAFILLHGPFGEDGTIQGLLDLLGIPYQGSGVLGSAMAINKNIAKAMYKLAGLPVPAWRPATARDLDRHHRLAEGLSFPVIVKPACQGSSLGMSLVREPAGLVDGLQKALGYDPEVMVEEYISGREITVGVLGNRDDLTALPLVEIIPGEAHVFFDYQAKYEAGASKEICPAALDAGISRRAQEYGILAHQALRLEGYSRTDMIVRDETIYVLETNTIPGMTPTSLLPQAAQAAGLPFPKLLDRLLELALEKKAYVPGSRREAR